MNTDTKVMMHTLKFANGNSVAVSELINGEVVQLVLSHNAGMATVDTKIVVSEQAARELGKLLIEHHDKDEATKRIEQSSYLHRRVNELAKDCLRLAEENKKLREQLETKKRKRKTG